MNLKLGGLSRGSDGQGRILHVRLIYLEQVCEENSSDGTQMRHTNMQATLVAVVCNAGIRGGTASRRRRDAPVHRSSVVATELQWQTYLKKVPCLSEIVHCHQPMDAIWRSLTLYEH